MDIRHLTGRTAPDAFRGRQQAPHHPSADAPSFREILQEVTELEFSGHAMQRLEDRSISVDKAGMQRLQEAVARAEQKGSKDSLILDGDQAYLVNIPNKTVVTAVDMMELRERVFTNIDSTVFTKEY
ncbi:TIGR02530 family flagellar biosynthesis protein [Fodinibius sediminis]|uniref:Flagellar operon protein n=1 Tax=Fodinibius sediminis TaxID=1214077 RepID=A0A521CIR9_9BACT|nr:TIGR02530 family flagellar biosynthesis protein [Fodinibius sediminis]SMO59346.1 flagellar operon protein [Fodinibius sediminis]